MSLRRYVIALALLFLPPSQSEGDDSYLYSLIMTDAQILKIFVVTQTVELDALIGSTGRPA